LCDEATSALDPESTADILGLLQKLNHTMKLTILLITHEMSVVKSICDRVGVMDNGKMVEVGEVVEVFANPEHEVTKSFLKQTMHMELPPQLKAKIHADKVRGMYPIVQMTFIGGEVSEPVTTALYEKFGITVNILQADLAYVKDTAVGFMVCQFIAKVVDLKKSQTFLKELGIKTEVLGYAYA
jgi:D-methionine transport system ATP-binding protein